MVCQLFKIGKIWKEERECYHEVLIFNYATSITAADSNFKDIPKASTKFQKIVIINLARDLSSCWQRKHFSKNMRTWATRNSKLENLMIRIMWSSCIYTYYMITVYIYILCYNRVHILFRQMQSTQIDCPILGNFRIPPQMLVLSSIQLL